MKSKQTNSKKQLFTPYMNSFSNLGEKNNSSMDWSSETPAPSSSMPISRISPAGEHVPSPHIPPSQSGSNSNNVVATTHRNGTCSLLTSAKLANGLSRSGDYKRT